MRIRGGGTTLKRFARLVAGLLILSHIVLFGCNRSSSQWRGQHKLIILGIDGMDPQLLRKFMRQGKTPNFAKLAAEGSFRELTTSIPPQSPVAWSNLITGMDAG